jgi:hypothetical protein
MWVWFECFFVNFWAFDELLVVDGFYLRVFCCFLTELELIWIFVNFLGKCGFRFECFGWISIEYGMIIMFFWLWVVFMWEFSVVVFLLNMDLFECFWLNADLVWVLLEFFDYIYIDLCVFELFFEFFIGREFVFYSKFHTYSIIFSCLHYCTRRF